MKTAKYCIVWLCFALYHFTMQIIGIESFCNANNRLYGATPGLLINVCNLCVHVKMSVCPCVLKYVEIMKIMSMYLPESKRIVSP